MQQNIQIHIPMGTHIPIRAPIKPNTIPTIAPTGTARVCGGGEGMCMCMWGEGGGGRVCVWRH